MNLNFAGVKIGCIIKIRTMSRLNFGEQLEISMNTKMKTVKVPTSLRTELLRVERERGRIYSLIRLSVFENTVYCVAINGEEFAAELVGGDENLAQKLFELLCAEGVPAYQLFDIVSDRKRDEMIEKA